MKDVELNAYGRVEKINIYGEKKMLKKKEKLAIIISHVTNKYHLLSDNNAQPALKSKHNKTSSSGEDEIVTIMMHDLDIRQGTHNSETKGKFSYWVRKDRVFHGHHNLQKISIQEQIWRNEIQK